MTIQESIELRIPERGLRIRRSPRPVGGGADYIDTADRPPDESPADFAARHGITNDTSDFMEIEAAGPGADRREQGAALSHEIVTEFTFVHPA